MGKIAKMVALSCALLACTSVKMVQREGCWVKQTERTLGGTTEELGFCSKQRPEWAQDRLARLVQECMAQADYRWENRAPAARTPAPPPTAVLAAPPATTTVVNAPAATPKPAASPCPAKPRTGKVAEKNAPTCEKSVAPEPPQPDQTAARDPRKS